MKAVRSYPYKLAILAGVTKCCIWLCLFGGQTAVADMYRSFSADARLHAPPPAKDYSGFIIVKFSNGTGVRVASEPVPAFQTARSDLHKDVEEANRVLGKAGAHRAARLFRRSEKEIRAEHARAEAKVRQSLPDKNLFFTVRVDNYARALEVLAALRTNAAVEVAYAAPRPVPPPATPDYTSQQTYLLTSDSNGYDVEYAWDQEGGDGSYVKLIDIEYDWYFEHEDLQMTEADLIYGARYTGFGTDHGTASVGISGARDNGYGMCGIVNQATIKFVGACNAGGSWQLADAIDHAVANTEPGDVILLEQQGDRGGGAYCPVEYYPDVYSAIVNATALDRIIIEPAGNGNQDLDAEVWGGIFSRATRDSLAIMVGAGNSTDRARCSFSSYGIRVDIQGWGNWSVASLGVGDLYGTVKSNQYTKTFSGTSSASALSAGVAASVQSYAKARWGFYLPPGTLRSNLVNNGYAQTFGIEGNIGPLPNLRNSYDAVDQAARELVVRSCRAGTCWPDGTNWYLTGTTLSCSLTNTTVLDGAGTRYTATGGTVFNNAFTLTGSTNITLTLTNNAVLIWQWQTQYLVQVSCSPNGSADTTNRWADAGSNVTVTASVSNYYRFAGWTGDTEGDTNSLTMTLSMDRPRQVTAHFAATLEAHGTPDWWLASHGLTNDTFANEETMDRDGDGAPAWQEYGSGTDPTNTASALAFSGLVVEPDRVVISWKGGVDAVQYLQSRSDLVSTTETWTSIFTNHPPTTVTTNYVDTNVSERLFYRIKVER